MMKVGEDDQFHAYCIPMLDFGASASLFAKLLHIGCNLVQLGRVSGCEF
jgi:hypothetical protein